MNCLVHEYLAFGDGRICMRVACEARGAHLDDREALSQRRAPLLHGLLGSQNFVNRHACAPAPIDLAALCAASRTAEDPKRALVHALQNDLSRMLVQLERLDEMLSA